MYKILTDVREPRTSSCWHHAVIFDAKIAATSGFISIMRAVVRTVRLAVKFDAIILTSNRRGNIAAAMLGILPRGIRPVVIMVDCLWYEPSGSAAKKIKRLQFRLLSGAVDRFIVWARHEITDYSRAFGIPASKFEFIPHHHTLEGFQYEICDGGYIFGGGDGDRDYATLLRALDRTDMPTIIATRRKEWTDLTSNPLVTIKPTTPTEFRQLMAGASLVVVPMAKGLLHSGGQQTYLNAMALGKAVIVADNGGAVDYIQNGVNGLLVPSGDSDALREAIHFIAMNPDQRSRICTNARRARKDYATEVCMQRILDLTIATIRWKRGAIAQSHD